jgi:SAM-dependent methyltransferase
MKWVLKAVVQKVISWLPNSQKVNFWFQKNITKGVVLSDDHFRDKLTHAIDHIDFYHEHCGVKSYRALELGSGWYPVVPIALFLNGVRDTVSIDISPLMNREAVITCINKYLEWQAKGQLGKLEDMIDPERWNQLKSLQAFDGSFDALCRKLRLKLLVTDARNTGLPADSFDLICSNNTYEHIYPDILVDIMKEFQRVLRPGGVSSHFIDMSDHFAHLDSSISIYNFLRYSSETWSMIDNSVQPQNRLRKRDYLEMYEKLGISLVDEKDRPGDPKVVVEEKLHPDFAEHYNAEELAVSHTHLVSSKNAGAEVLKENMVHS